ncbi:uncharacterized protein F4807DRAFT_471086 [Annulohypoxylon truncatum]|uniref:uncharacterized protein n=1 Tax=Annulohypoxylon truncatum TaxID=327061 RepID=UPI0020075E79|nr:uncharacterized protein F4807DRAFT_471086 [Annulohypoxylon truncatum]KAI1205407.1 hypothetical protein F4807DRAFT_471086 [Annulohypoxylon truncatum]
MDYIYEMRPSGDLPYIDILNYFKENLPERYLLEPDIEDAEQPYNALRRVKIDEATEVQVAQQSKDFGSLSHVFQRDYPGIGTYTWVFFRRNRGSLDHGLGRANENMYECAKFNVIRGPRGSQTNNPDYNADTRGLACAFDEQMLQLAAYPQTNHRVMSAPLLPRCVPLEEFGPGGEVSTRTPGQFSIPKKQQPSALTRVFVTPELCLRIMSMISHRWEDVSNLSRTCQTILFALNNISTHVDIGQGNFLNMNVPDHVLEDTNREYGYIIRPGSSEFVVVSGIRQFAEANKPTYRGVVRNMFPLMETISVRGLSMKILQLHTIPSLNIKILGMILKCLPNLEVLGVHNCELLHFGATIPLLETVVSHNSESGKGPIRVDFSPFYYTGIRCEDGGKKGEYGVIPSDLGTIETRRAVVAVLRTAISIAIENGIDWFSPGTGMRLFLDRLPWAIGSIRYILESLYNLHYLDAGFYGPPADNSSWMNAIKRTLWNDLVLAIHGRAMGRRELDCIMTDGMGNLNLTKCVGCEVDFPLYFYTKESIENDPSLTKCHGCELQLQLYTHVDNFYQEKRDVAEALVLGGQVDLHTLLNGKQIATGEELGDRSFSFWRMSVKTKQEVLEACSGNTNALVLDGRPGGGLPDDYKQIWLWKKSMDGATNIAHRDIDDGAVKAQKRIAMYQGNLDRLHDVYFSGALRCEVKKQYIRDKAEEMSRQIDRQRARCGLIQMGGNHCSGALAAADWDAEIEAYRQTLKSIDRISKDTDCSKTPWDLVFPTVW